MQKPMDDWSNTRDRPSQKQSRNRSMFLRFLFSVSGFVLLALVSAGAMFPKLVNMPNTYAAQSYAFHNQDQTQNNTNGQATVQLDPNKHTLFIQAQIFNAPSNTPLVMHIHKDGSCTGAMVFLLQATSDNKGQASTSMTLTVSDQDTKLPTDWYFNVHDTTRKDADGNPLSIACGSINIDSSGLKGLAQLCAVQQPSNEPQKALVQSTASGLTTLQLNPTAHSLTVEAVVFGAPPNTPLVMHIHGDGSCTGPMLYQLQATSDSAGHAFTTMTFNDQQDNAIPNNWFFNVHDTTSKGADGNPLSIACGPIQPIDSIIAFAKLDPVQPSTSSPSASPTPAPSTTQNNTEGITTLQLNPSTHTLVVGAVVFDAPPNTPLVMHVHGDNSCTGPMLYQLQATSDSAGNAFATKSFTDQQDTTIPNNWYFNVHDTTRKDADGKPLSIACGAVQVTGSSKLTAGALLCPVPVSQTPSSPTAKPKVVPLTAITSPMTGFETQYAIKGLTVLYLNTTAHTLNLLVHVVGAPPNTPLAMDIHGGGSCTGPTLFLLQTKSDSTGNATAVMPFTDRQDTTISSQWFFNIHDATKLGPDGHLQSIACGPIMAAGNVGLSQLNLFQFLPFNLPNS